MSAQSSTSSEVVLTQNERFSNGTVTEITANTVKAVDNTTGEVVEFTHPGAQVVLVVGDLVSYRLITFPNGKPPVVIEIKRPM